MIIIKLILEGNKRLLLNKIQRIEVTPNNVFQIILGTNGSGKSSLLYELSPLPAPSSDYIKGGSKTIELEVGLDHYLLTSTFKSGNKHSFIKNDEELNPGGTGKVQKTLVEKEFRITKDLHDLFSGRILFTEMSPALRREWITRLSDNDLTYALGLFKRLRTKERDALGGLRHCRNRLYNESNRLVDFKDRENLEERVVAARSVLASLMEAKRTDLESSSVTRGRLQSALRAMSQVNDHYTTLDLKRPVEADVESYDEVEAKIRTIEKEITVNEAILSRSVEEYSELEKIFSSLQNANVDNVDVLEERRNEIQNQLSSVTPVHMFNIEQAENKLMDTHEVERGLVELLSSMADNTDQSFTQTNIALQKEKYNEFSVKKEKVLRRKSHVESQIKHMEDAKDETCPKCKYVWRPGVSEDQLEGFYKERSGLEELVVNLDLEILKVNEYLEAFELWKNDAHRFKRMVDNYPRLQLLWDSLIESKLIYNNPKTFIPVVKKWSVDLEICRRKQALESDLEQIQIALKEVSETKDAQHLQNRYAHLDSEITNLNSKRQKLNEVLAKLSSYGRNVIKANEINAKLNEISAALVGLRDDCIASEKNDAIASVFQEEQSRLAMLENQLTELQAVESVVKDLETDEVNLDSNHALLKLLGEELSPHGGLIAEQLKGFIDCLVGQVNEIIGQNWTYQMEVQSCGMEDSDLDYKFPLMVSTPDNIVPDVSESSVGQKEIINFAFKLVAMLYLDFNEYPLYLDELGSGCDEQHRVNIVNYLKMLVESKRHPQLFFISHYAATHGALSGADVLVLDSTNITVPGKANEHVVFN